MKKKILFITLILCTVSTIVYSESSSIQLNVFYENIKLKINGIESKMTTESGEVIEPFIVNDSVYVPIRGVAQALGKNVEWDCENKSVLVKDNEEVVKIKKISFLGDSITYGAKCDDLNKDPYPYLLGKMIGAETVVNNSISGTALSQDNEYGKSFVNRYSELDKDSDLIIVMGGTNEMLFGNPLGNIKSTDTSTTYGALKELAFGLKHEYPNSKIVFCTLLKEKTGGEPLGKIANAIKEVCEVCDISCIDVYNSKECDFTNDTSEYMGDGLHPNSKGHKVMAQYIYSQLVSMGII